MNTSIKVGLLVGSICLSLTNANAQVCKTDVITPSHPDGQYLILSDLGVVTDIVNGIQWKICSEGQSFNSEDKSCELTPTHFPTWKEALSTPDSDYAGFTGWRLPNVKELASLVERACVAPAINLDIFYSTPSSVYWSSTFDNQLNHDKGIYGRVVNFTDGTEFLDNTDGPRYVRLVRTIVE
jgi:hypothetical protein